MSFLSGKLGCAKFSHSIKTMHCLLKIARGWQSHNNTEASMVMYFCRTACPVIALSLMLLLLSPTAIAYSENLNFSPQQPIAGQPTLAVLSGISGSSCPLINPPVITRVGNQIDLTSTPLFSTLGCLAVLSPYTMTANLGLLPAGTYVVTWSVNPSVNAFTPQTRTLIVTNPSPIPASSTASLALAAASILAIGMASLRAASGKKQA